MNSSEFNKLLLRNFLLNPTKDQFSALKSLTDFLYNKNNSTVFLLRGYAGTGKTTLMKTLVENLHYSKMSYSLLAPTGRAAKVLSKYTQRKTYTVHKKIYYSKVDSSGNFKSTLKTNKLKNIVFIVDEASMISESLNSNDLFKKKSLLSDIIEFIDFKTNSKLIFIGDSAQLPQDRKSVV